MENNFWEWLLIALAVFAVFNINRWPEAKEFLEKNFKQLNAKAQQSKKEFDKRVNETKENMAQKREAAQKAKEAQKKADEETTQDLD